MTQTNEQQNWPEWSTAQREIDVLRAAIHHMADDILIGTRLPDHVFREEQAVVDYYISLARARKDI